MTHQTHKLLADNFFITDGGLETELVFKEEWDLPEFASFVLLDSPSGLATLDRYYQNYIDIAVACDSGLILEAPTWRASPGWGNKIGYSETDLWAINQLAMKRLAVLRKNNSHLRKPILISGCIGPHGDGYAPDELLSIEEARKYHSFQANAFATTEADLLCAMTITNVEEAIGIALAAREAKMPLVMSFTVETDGRLPSGVELEEAISIVDRATGSEPAYYMINCAHPTHFMHKLGDAEQWTTRIRGIRANASCKSHAELDNSTELDAGNPAELAVQYRSLRKLLPNLTVIGGCCGTNHTHVSAMAQACQVQ